jgi:hypothetical protein
MPGSTTPSLIPYMLATDDLASLDEWTLSLATRLQALVAQTNEYSGSTNASGEVTVSHGLATGFPPRCVMVTPHTGTGAPIYRVKGNPTATQFTVEIRTDAGALLTSSPVSFYWAAWP